MNPTQPVPACQAIGARAPTAGWPDRSDGFRITEIDREWQDFLALGQRVDASSLGIATNWRHPPVLLSF